MPRIQHKRGTSANLASVNPTPLAGELVWDSTENAIKVGDGATAWASLAYVTATPRTHVHDGADITTGTVAYARLPVGSTTSTVCAGDDARLTDARTPTAHKASHATGGSDALSPSDLGAAPAASPTFTGVITVAAGTAAAPAIVASGDPNTGLLWPAADTVAISTAGVERVRVDSSGRVGIGRTPSVSGTSLECAGNIYLPASKSIQFTLTNEGVGIGTPSNNGVQFWATSNSTNYFRFQGRDTTNGTFGATDIMRIVTGGTGAGNVGIGNNSPASRLDVSGVITVSATSGSAGSYAPSLTFSGDPNTGFGQVSGQSDTASIFTAGHERVRVDSSGRVGIGTTSMSARLDVSSTGTAIARFTSTHVSSVAYLWLANSGGEAFVGSVANGIRFLNNASANILEVKSDGKLGVGSGNTSPTATLDVNGDTIRLRTAKTPASASDTGNAGDICWDASYLYICTATNTWRRIAHSTW